MDGLKQPLPRRRSGRRFHSRIDLTGHHTPVENTYLPQHLIQVPEEALLAIARMQHEQVRQVKAVLLGAERGPWETVATIMIGLGFTFLGALLSQLHSSDAASVSASSISLAVSALAFLSTGLFALLRARVLDKAVKSLLAESALATASALSIDHLLARSRSEDTSQEGRDSPARRRFHRARRRRRGARWQ